MRVLASVIVGVLWINSPVAALESERLNVVAAEDLALSPARWLNRPVELRRVNCYYAGPEEVRCTRGVRQAPALTVIAQFITPEAMEKHIPTVCDTVKVAFTNRCLFTIRLSPQRVDFDRIANYQRRTIVRSTYIYAIRTGR